MILPIILSVLALVIIFLGILIIRAVLFKPNDSEILEIEEISFDKEKALSSLQELIKCKTVSYEDDELQDEKEFKKLRKLLPTLYPEVDKKCELLTFDGGGLLFKLKGETNGKASVFMSHYDVVDVDENTWDKPPFDAIVEDGVIWGRGSIDTKITFNATLFALDTLLKNNFVPKNDIYLAFSGSEEINGVGAKKIVEYFKEQKIELEMVIDEGGAIVENVFPGVHTPTALVGIAEKGMLKVEYSVKSQGGHASAPKPNSPIVKLSKTCCKLESKPFKMHVTKPVAELFDIMGRRSTFLYRLIFANLWLFKGVLNLISKKSGGEMNALLRTTNAFTQSKGSPQVNVIPPVATMASDIRLNPMDTYESAMEYLKKTIDDEKVELKILTASNPSNISRTDVLGYERISNSIKETWDNVTVSPYLMVQCSDSRHYSEISDRVYRFSAMELTTEERSTIHGSNERNRVKNVEKSVEFYIRLMKKC